MKFLPVLLICTLLISCKESVPNEAVELPSETEGRVTECFVNYSGRDTIEMRMHRVNDSVTGDLIYHWFERDGNTGTFTGIFIGDTLRTEYEFQSEGLISVREEIFIRSGDSLISGYGPVVMKNGKQVFENRASINFDNSLVLVLSDCNDVKTSKSLQ